MSKENWLGVDLGKKTFVVALATDALVPKQWSRMAWHEFPNSKAGCHRLCQWVRKTLGDETLVGVCVEATGPLAWSFVDTLNQRLGAVSSVNPRFICAYGRSLGLEEKTDRIDACVMAQYGQATRPQARPIPTKTQRALHEVHTVYEGVQGDIQAWKNRLESCTLNVAVQRKIRSTVRHLTNLAKEFEAQMDVLIDSQEQTCEDARRLQTIPGVGRKTVRLILAHLGDLRQYKRNEITALTGLYPVRFESGTSTYRKPRVARSGKQQLRKGLYFPAIVAKKHCPPLNLFAKRLLQRGLAPKAVVIAVMRKLLILMRQIVISETDFKCA